MTGRLLIQADVVVELGLLLINLILLVFALSLLDLERSHLQEQLENLVLNLAILQCCRIGTTCRLDLAVECISLGCLCSLSGGLDNGQIASRDALQIACINLEPISHVILNSRDRNLPGILLELRPKRFRPCHQKPENRRIREIAVLSSRGA